MISCKLEIFCNFEVVVNVLVVCNSYEFWKINEYNIFRVYLFYDLDFSRLGIGFVLLGLVIINFYCRF